VPQSRIDSKQLSATKALTSAQIMAARVFQIQFLSSSLPSDHLRGGYVDFDFPNDVVVLQELPWMIVDGCAQIATAAAHKVLSII
jgi:hypothetical protein